MSDKQLDESAWKAFAAKHDIPDGAPLLKALAQLGRAEKQGPAEVLEALSLLDKQLALLAKAHKANKPVARQLEDMEAASSERQKAAAKQIKSAADDEDAEGADSPALLSSKMTPLLRELRKGEARMAAMVCTAGRETAVLIMRRAISPARRALLAAAVDAKGGAKYLVGDCAYEEGVLTFVLPSASAGLAKRLREALLKQVQLRLKVRVRGDDGALDDDGEDEPPQASEQPASTPPAPPAPAAAAPAAPAAAAVAEFKTRLSALLPRIKAAQAAGHPAEQDLRLKLGEAGELAKRLRFEEALQLLGEAETLLATTTPGGASGTGGAAGALANWSRVRTETIAILKDLAKKVAAARHEKSATALIEVNAVIKNLTAEPSTAQQVAELERWLQQDEVVADVSAMAQDIRTPLLGALSGLKSALP